MHRRTILITGATRGLGRALAERYLEEGHRVYGCGRSAEELAKLGEAPAFTALDVSDSAAVEDWATRLLDRQPPPDLLLNNAALINRSAPLWEVSAAEMSSLVDVNVKGVHHLIRSFLPAMIAAGRGVVVNFSSGWGRSTSPEVAPYCATKWALEGLSRALAQELPDGLAAVPFNPGIIHTEMLSSAFGANAAHYPEPDAWAERAAPYLLSLGPQHNGQALTAPGG